jgi:Fe-S-cluster containining protein
MLRATSARYRCTGCGDCCRGWDVPLQPGEADAFRRAADGVIPAERLARAVGRARHGGVEVETLVGTGGQCVALADDQLCRIHAARGAEAKPRACRIFPLTFVATPGAEVRVGLSYACPAVLDGEGEPLDTQPGEVESVFRGAIEGSRYLLRVPSEVKLADGVALPWSDARALVDAMVAAAREEGRLARRLCRAGAVCALTQLGLEEGRAFAEALVEAGRRRESLVDEALAAPLEIDRLSRALHRTLLRTTAPSAGLLARIGGMFGGEVALRDGRKVAPPAIERVRPGMGDDGEALLARWFADGLEALTFFGDGAFGLSISAGLDWKTLAASVAAYLARAHAAASGRVAVELADVKAGLRQLEAGVTHRSSVPTGLSRALGATACLDLLREQL